jgi:hypothetical protein
VQSARRERVPGGLGFLQAAAVLVGLDDDRAQVAIITRDQIPADRPLGNVARAGVDGAWKPTREREVIIWNDGQINMQHAGFRRICAGKQRVHAGVIKTLDDRDRAATLADCVRREQQEILRRLEDIVLVNKDGEVHD